LSLFARFQRFAWDLAGIVLLVIALLTLMSLVIPELTSGRVLVAWNKFLSAWFGWGSFLVVIAIGVAALLVLRLRFNLLQTEEDLHENPIPEIHWGRVFALEFAAFGILSLLAMMGESSLERAEAGLDGGRIGWGLATLLKLLLEPLGLNSAIWPEIFLAGSIILLLIYGLGFAGPIRARLARWLEAGQGITTLESEPAVSVAPTGDPEQHSLPLSETKKRRTLLAPDFRKHFRMSSPEEKSIPPPSRDERLPSLDLLVPEQAARADERNINQTAGLIEQTLAEFGIPAKVIGFRVGPSVTQFAVEPGFIEKSSSVEEEAARQKVRVAQIAALRRDLALALAAERLRIEAPVPGRPYVGIEVPNIRTTVVRLRQILESEVFYKVASPLAIALGRDVSGQPVVADLMRMPHLLIAGTTGSGKSVCIAALTTCLVMNNTPEDLRLVMIDPKMVELVRFNGLPHLYGKVETDLQRILGVLRWVVMEMDRRYILLEEMAARHIDSYNRKIRRRKGGVPLPRIVVMIDELADLMMSAPEQTEPNLIRLAQMARATGIHLVVATQRPSTDVVTGLIKANFPARISFAVASSVDSRVILDTTGAESLLGHGDMLFLPPEASGPQRTQGVMVSDQEVERVITFWQQAHPHPETIPPPWESMLAEEEILADRDALINQAINFVKETQRASTSLLQRRLRIGYPRAARLMDELEQLGVVGPSQGGGREREVLIGPQDDLPEASLKHLDSA
jgi:S-DNA-T family DNA segregation ATPase FtsK/SpoIIIE